MTITHAPKPGAKRAPKKGKDPLLSDLLAWGLHRRRMSGRDLSRRSGINQSIVSRLLSGKRCNPMPETAEKLGVVLGIKWPVILEAARRSRSAQSIFPVGE